MTLTKGSLRILKFRKFKFQWFFFLFVKLNIGPYGYPIMGAWNLKAAGRRAKQIEVWDSGDIGRTYMGYLCSFRGSLWVNLSQTWYQVTSVQNLQIVYVVLLSSRALRSTDLLFNLVMVFIQILNSPKFSSRVLIIWSHSLLLSQVIMIERLSF